MAITSDTMFHKFQIDSKRQYFWHVATDGVIHCCKLLLATRKELTSKRFAEMEEWEKGKICRECLGANAYKGTVARREAYKAGCGVPAAPLCPYCSAQITCTDAKYNRLKWWREGRKWKCFGCGKLFTAEEIEDANSKK